MSRAIGRSIPQLKDPEDLRDRIPFTAVTTDSRQVKPGCLFVALTGETADGHDYIQNAVKAGARGVIHKRSFQVEPQADVLFFPVDDTLDAYRAIAGAWRREFSLPLVAVAGSVGKTTTKEILSAILRGKYSNVLRTEGSQNGYVGIPLTLLRLTPEHDVAVIEVGIDEVGAMEKHMALVSAGTAVLTRIGPEHLERLHDLPTVAYEEGIALSAVAKAGGTIVVNLDDPWIRPHATTLRNAKRVCFTLNGTAAPDETGVSTLSAEWTTPQKDRLRFEGMENPSWEVNLPLPGAHNGSNLAAAVAVALSLGLTPEEIQKGLSDFQGAYGRSEMAELNGSPVVCDYYNANPSSVEAGLELLNQVASQQSPPRRKWACLGDMLELGTEEEKFHRDLSAAIEKVGLQGVLLYGNRMKWLEDELKRRGFSGHISHHESHEALIQELRKNWQNGDALLIKGSRGMRMENVWKGLKA
jgi:UDP-N-acetylmuramoyl-tripeptide--D-alanyl-D-alanine ligase